MPRSKTLKLFLMDGEPSGKRTVKDRKKYENKIDSNGILTADVLLSSPSSAAGFVGGASLSGNAHWKDADGKTLRELLETD